MKVKEASRKATLDLTETKKEKSDRNPGRKSSCHRGIPVITEDILFTIKTSGKHKINVNIHTHMQLLGKPLKRGIELKKEKSNLQSLELAIASNVNERRDETVKETKLL